MTTWCGGLADIEGSADRRFDVQLDCCREEHPDTELHHDVRQGVWFLADDELGDRPPVLSAALMDQKAGMDQVVRDYEVTVETIRAHVRMTARSPAWTDHGRGYEKAMRDVAAILDKHGAAPGEAVHFGADGDSR